jgi:hypothetical protein
MCTSCPTCLRTSLCLLAIDLKLAPLLVSPVESFLFSQQAFPAFAQHYLTAHNQEVRSAITSALAKEHLQHSGEEGSIAQFYVRNPNLGDKQLIGGEKCVYDNKRAYGNIHPSSFSSSESTNLFESVDQQVIDAIDQMKSSVFDAKQRKPSPRNGNTNNPPGLLLGRQGSQAVPESFFWGPNTMTRHFKQDLLATFKQYFTAQLEAGLFDINAFPLSMEMSQLIEASRKTGYSTLQHDLQALSSRIQAMLLHDIDVHRAAILDNIELAILAQELPGRLLVFHSVIQDPQIYDSVRLVRGEAVDVFNNLYSATQSQNPRSGSGSGPGVGGDRKNEAGSVSGQDSSSSNRLPTQKVTYDMLLRPQSQSQSQSQSQAGSPLLSPSSSQ